MKLILLPNQAHVSMACSCVYLGFIVGGVVEVDKLMSIQQLPIPMVKRDVRAFLGITGYYLTFITNYQLWQHL